MLALASMGFCELMFNERLAAQTSARQSQARSLAQSGVEVARQFLDRSATDQTNAGGIYDNSDRFYNQLVADDPLPRDCGRFSIVAPCLSSDGKTVSDTRYGLQDESSRLSLAKIASMLKSKQDTEAKAILMKLPGMTDEIADAILDWIDSDDTTREQGAEVEYYSALSPPYAPRNAVPVTIDELLLVRGVTPELLFGLDAAKMGLVSDTSTNGGTLAGVDNSDGSMDHGWAAYLTLWSAESTLKSDGSAKINLNQDDLKTLHTQLSDAVDRRFADFVVFYRQSSGAGPNNAVTVLSGDQPNFNTKAKKTISSVLDLVGAMVWVTSGAGTTAKKHPFPSPIGPDSAAMSTYQSKLFDNCTTTTSSSIVGRININQAPRVVLMCIPNMTEDIADQIISNRSLDPDNTSTDQQYPTWPLAQGLVSLDVMKKLAPYVTTAGSVYRAQVIGSFDKGNPVARVEAIVNASKHPAKVVFWRDLSRQPSGFPGEPAKKESPEGE